MTVAYTWAGKGRSTARRQANFLLKWSFSLLHLALFTIGPGAGVCLPHFPLSDSCLCQFIPGCTFHSVSLHTLGFTPMESIYQLRFCFHDWREFVNTANVIQKGRRKGFIVNARPVLSWWDDTPREPGSPSQAMASRPSDESFESGKIHTELSLPRNQLLLPLSCFEHEGDF